MITDNQLITFKDYASLSEGRLVAVNSLGEPFFDVLGTLVKVSPETGDREEVGPISENLLDGLDDYWTADSLRAAWEAKHGPVAPAKILVPITPFALGGEFDANNLMAVPVAEAISLYRAVREKISDLPDGSSVSIEVTK